MTNATLTNGSMKLKATDGLILATLVFFTCIGVIFQVEQWPTLTLKNLAVGIAYIVFIKFSERANGKFLKFCLRVAAVTLTYAYMFGAVNHLQLILHNGWQDEAIIAMEDSLFGVQPLLWTQQFISQPLTEWMMFSYVIYLPMYPALCALIYYKHGEFAMEDYFFTLGIANILCDIGFILYPVASPMYWPALKAQLTVPLDGWVWTYFGELMRKYLHFAGGSIPSPHAAAGTVMWAMAYRYYRPGFWVLAPIMISLYISTFYARYHYVTDAVIGVLVALAAIRFAPSLMKLWEQTALKNFKSEPS
jgi:hypothetical protein